MQRFNFQFTGQRFYKIIHGELTGQVRDVAYQATTTDFWGAMEAVGGPETWQLGGAFNCGKAQPGQVAPVSHGCPSALFRDIRILNTTQERRDPTTRPPGMASAPESWSSTRSRPRWPTTAWRSSATRPGQPAVGEQHAHDERRDARRARVVVSFVKQAAGVSVGSVSGSA